MSNLAQRIHENSERFLPAFARLKTSTTGRPTRYAPLDLVYREASPMPSTGETELGRWVVLGGCLFTVTDAGTPMETAPVGASGRPMQLFYGGGEFLLTERRVVGIVMEGETVVGKAGDGSILALSYPLWRIGSISIDLKQRLFGGVKEKRLHLISTDGTVTDLFIDDVIAQPGRGPRGFERFSGTKRDLLEAFVRPVVQARRAGGGDSAALRAAEQGVREQTAEQISVDFLDAR
jgi:hypothetical protein